MNNAREPSGGEPRGKLREYVWQKQPLHRSGIIRRGNGPEFHDCCKRPRSDELEAEAYIFCIVFMIGHILGMCRARDNF